jgi:hypothetical protein
MFGDLLIRWLLPLIVAAAVGAATIFGIYQVIPEGHLPAWFAGFVLFVLTFLLAFFLAKRWQGDRHPW